MFFSDNEMDEDTVVTGSDDDNLSTADSEVQNNDVVPR